MELVEGDDLAVLLSRARLSLDESLTIARQIADTFSAAHEQGIVHGDLKPANIKLAPGGNVKILDFGLAKSIEAASTSATISNSPTLSLFMRRRRVCCSAPPHT